MTDFEVVAPGETANAEDWRRRALAAESKLDQAVFAAGVAMGIASAWLDVLSAAKRGGELKARSAEFEARSVELEARSRELLTHVERMLR